MNHLQNFKRSINIWKISDRDSMDIYVDIYLWMEELFKDLKKFTSSSYPLNIYYGTSSNNIILEEDFEYESNNIDYDRVYKVFKSKYSNYIDDYYTIM